jgi:predicted anti-sigma-YlaC factor YlaD
MDKQALSKNSSIIILSKVGRINKVCTVQKASSAPCKICGAREMPVDSERKDHDITSQLRRRWYHLMVNQKFVMRSTKNSIILT